jgi:hypothetical protein
MDEPIVTFGVLMGMEVDNEQNNGAGGNGKEALLVFCPTGETEEGNIDVTPRMKDFALMGFRPVAITRCNPADPCNYTIFAKDGLSKPMQNAVLNDTWHLLREAMEGSELLKYSSTDNNND